MIDFRNMDSQAALEALFEQTNFVKEHSFDGGIYIEAPDGDGHQFVWIDECKYMGSITVVDFVNHGYDALFVQTLVQFFKQGKLKFVDCDKEKL